MCICGCSRIRQARALIVDYFTPILCSGGNQDLMIAARVIPALISFIRSDFSSEHSNDENLIISSSRSSLRGSEEESGYRLRHQGIWCLRNLSKNSHALREIVCLGGVTPIMSVLQQACGVKDRQLAAVATAAATAALRNTSSPTVVTLTSIGDSSRPLDDLSFVWPYPDIVCQCIIILSRISMINLPGIFSSELCTFIIFVAFKLYYV